jgi:hypothetical protein
MERFLIEVPHPADKVACLQAIKLLLETGSHFLTNAEFGCMDGEHSAWIIVEAESKEEARAILPRPYRMDSKVTQLCRFGLKEVQEMLEHHPD